MRVNTRIANGAGYTMVELMMAVLVSGLLMGAIYASFKSQNDSYVQQDEISAMQQNLRIAGDMLTREIRLAGYDQLGGVGGATVLTAAPTIIKFASDSVDINALIGNDEQVSFGFLMPGSDANNDGIADAGIDSLYRLQDDEDANDPAPVADNIEAIGFAYAYDANNNGIAEFNDQNIDGLQQPGERFLWAVDTDNDGKLDLNLDTNNDNAIDAADDGDANGEIEGVPLASVVAVSRVRAVRVWLLARSQLQDLSYNDNRTYVVGRRVITTNDNFRRRLLETTIYCKNMGISP